MPFLLAAFLFPRPVSAQQDDVRRYDLFAGFTGFETPELNLAERGFHMQSGVNLRGWLSAGFDYSVVTGHNALTPNLLKSSLQQELTLELEELAEEGLIPANYQLVVPTNAFSQTFAAGPQLELRHFSAVTLFLRPSLGAIRQRVTPRPQDAVSTLVVEQLVPAGYKIDWSGFYGVGGGFDWNATRHFAIRMQTDLVYWRLFDDLLAHGTWTVRYSVGPTFRFGRNIVRQ
ncbi:hypothetical protein ESZ00_18290 [Silvibacterium dinghuense]|uniref:Outer membrane protein beta-barrel domain-containing protein n=1 Tax=Silvibacterium dinghuense TaxID=1560006 RepID=A0A4Q1S925_9BACT|nr:hypothetical protein ESZ00_18290 [Silvibacterium dinghuense]